MLVKVIMDNVELHRHTAISCHREAERPITDHGKQADSRTSNGKPKVPAILCKAKSGKSLPLNRSSKLSWTFAAIQKLLAIRTLRAKVMTNNEVIKK